MAERIMGQKVVVKIGEEVLGGQRNATLDISASTADVTTKDSDGWVEEVVVSLSWSSNCDGLYFVSDAAYQKVVEAMLAKQPVTLVFSDEAGKIYRSGKANITSISEEAGHEDAVAYAISFTGTGALVMKKPLGLSVE